jgi:hypothetical protein
MKTVNAKGLKEIRGYLSDLHKQEIFTDAQVSQFAAEIADSLNDGGYPSFVIAANESKSGVEEVCIIDDEGYDIEYFDMDPTPRGRNHHDRNDCERYACRICVAFEH